MRSTDIIKTIEEFRYWSLSNIRPSFWRRRRRRIFSILHSAAAVAKPEFYRWPSETLTVSNSYTRGSKWLDRKTRAVTNQNSSGFLEETNVQQNMSMLEFSRTPTAHNWDTWTSSCDRDAIFVSKENTSVVKSV